MTSTEELAALDPEPNTATLASGTTVVIEPLRTRQFFKLLKIVTRGAFPVLNNAMLPSPGEDAEAFATKLMSLLLLSIPEAEDETIEFIKAMCSPVGLRPGGRRASKEDVEYNAELWTKLDAELNNPALDDLITLIEAIITHEADDIQALGKRLVQMFRLAQKTGQIPNTERAEPPIQSQTSVFSEVSVDLSTSSPASTDGPTTS